MAAPKVSVLILTRRRLERLRGCLASVRSQDFADLEVIVLANGCAESAAAVRAEYPDVRLVELPSNVGCAPGRNRIAAEARGELLLFLDDDGEIREPSSISRLVASIESDPRAGVVSMALYDAADDKPTGWILREAKLDYRSYHASFAGGASIVRAVAFRAASGYCEAFPGPGEEFDLTVRLYAAGWAVVHDPSVAFHHHVAKDREDWRVLVSQGYAHLQFTIWRLYPKPWRFLASMKALATQLWIDVRHSFGVHLIAEAHKSHVWAHRARRIATPVPVRALELLYYAKYVRTNSWEELERAPAGFLRSVLRMRLRRKRLGVAKLPPPRRPG